MSDRATMDSSSSNSSSSDSDDQERRPMEEDEDDTLEASINRLAQRDLRGDNELEDWEADLRHGALEDEGDDNAETEEHGNDSGQLSTSSDEEEEEEEGESDDEDEMPGAAALSLLQHILG